MSVYLSTDGELSPRSTPYLHVEAVDQSSKSIGKWFTLPCVAWVGAHTGCSCGFPSISAEEPLTYYEGFFDKDDPEQRTKDLASVEALLSLLREAVAASGRAELLAVWAGDEVHPPKGSISLRLSDVTAKEFFLIEGFLYRIDE